MKKILSISIDSHKEKRTKEFNILKNENIDVNKKINE
jgi:hypothetical protein